MKFVATIDMHFQATSVEHAERKLKRVREDLEERATFRICRIGFSEEKEEHESQD